MGMSYEDIQREEMWSAMHHELVMEKAGLAQCIYVFVEGHSEEAVLHCLLKEKECDIDFKELGVVVANYNGINNLKHAVRLLRQTLSHDRPIIVTYDDDPSGKRNLKYIKNDPLLIPFRIPIIPRVTYKDNSKGGSLEEAFNEFCFIDSCFDKDVAGSYFMGNKDEFTSNFKIDLPWYSQFCTYVDSKGGRAKSINKVRLAENMAESCQPIPETFIELSNTIREVRNKCPIKHPDDVDFPESWVY